MATVSMGLSGCAQMKVVAQEVGSFAKGFGKALITTDAGIQKMYNDSYIEAMPSMEPSKGKLGKTILLDTVVVEGASGIIFGFPGEISRNELLRFRAHTQTAVQTILVREGFDVRHSNEELTVTESKAVYARLNVAIKGKLRRNSREKEITWHDPAVQIKTYEPTGERLVDRKVIGFEGHSIPKNRYAVNDADDYMVGFAQLFIDYFADLIVPTIDEELKQEFLLALENDISEAK
jgi:hypothetical protein